MQVIVEGHLHDPDLHLLHQLRRGEESGVILEETVLEVWNLHLFCLQLEQFWNIPQHTVGVLLTPPLSENTNQSGSRELGKISG